MRDARTVPIVAPAAGFEDESPRTLSEWAHAMKAVWREKKSSQYPRASLGAMAGLGVDRAERIVNGNAIPTPTEAAALDHALGTDASRHFPPRRPFVQHAVAPISGEARPTIRVRVKKTGPALTAPRQRRVDEWAPLFAASGMSLAAIAEATDIGQGRVMRILRQGAIPDRYERESLVDVLGEPSTAENGIRPPPVPPGDP